MSAERLAYLQGLANGFGVGLSLTAVVVAALMYWRMK